MLKATIKILVVFTIFEYIKKIQLPQIIPSKIMDVPDDKQNKRAQQVVQLQPLTASGLWPSYMLLKMRQGSQEAQRVNKSGSGGPRKITEATSF